MITEYHRPKSLDEALALLAREEASTYPLAGGTKISQPSSQAFEVVDLQALGLDTIKVSGKTLELGATLTLQGLLDYAQSGEAGKLGLQPALIKAIKHEATYNLRQAATLAGTLVAANGRSPFTTAALALDIRLTLQPGDESISLGDLLPLRQERLHGRLITKISFPLNAQAMVGTAVQEGMLSQRINPLKVARAIGKSFGTIKAHIGEDLKALYDTQLLLNQLPGHLYGGDLAEYLGIPWAVVSVIPLARTRYRPIIGLPTSLSWLPGYNRLTYWLGEQLAWQMFRSSINHWRAETLGLPPRSFFGAIGDIYRDSVPIIHGFSPLVVAPPPDWGEHIHTTGWWYPDDPDWQPPAGLLRFLDDGPPPVFLGFGSMPVHHPARITALLLEALRLCGARAILHAGWAGLGAQPPDDAFVRGNLPSNIFPITYAPYAWLFERMAAIVHHGGSGTSGFSFRSGVPSIIVPFGFDQYYWGRRAAQLGVGPNPLPFKKLSAERLAAAIRQAITDHQMRQRAAELGKKLRAETGIQDAADVIQSILQRES
ncbi:FAD binding domain-containing protein [Chloroflexota bacterium]